MKSRAILLGLASLCWAGNASATELNLHQHQAKALRPARVAIGAGLGTAGIEAQAAVRVSRRLALRAGANILEVQRSQRFDDITYDADANATTGSAFLDIRPFANAFTLTGGGYFGSRRVTLRATPQNAVEIDGVTFTPAQVGGLDGALDLGDAAPFAGIAFDNSFQGKPGLGVRLSAGIAFGKSDVQLASSGGTFSSNPILLNAIAEEESNIRDDLALLRFYPVLSFGLTWSF